MTLSSLQALSWGTVASAVASALLLAAREPGGLEVKHLHPLVSQPRANEAAAPTARLVGGLVPPHPEQVQRVAPR